MNRILYVVVIIVVYSSELLYAQQRVLIPLEAVLKRSSLKYNNFWVDTLGANFNPNITPPPYSEITERLHTRLPLSMIISEDIIDLSNPPSVGDQMRKTMFKPEYQSWCDSLQAVAQEFGGASYILKEYSNDDMSWNVSSWRAYFTDTVPINKIQKRVEELNLYTIHSRPKIYIGTYDPLVELTTISVASTQLSFVECHPSPATSYVHIHLPNDKSLANTGVVEFISTSGTVVAKHHVQLSEVDGKLSGTLSLNGISNGVYLIRLGDYTKLISVVR